MSVAPTSQKLLNYKLDLSARHTRDTDADTESPRPLSHGKQVCIQKSSSLQILEPDESLVLKDCSQTDVSICSARSSKSTRPGSVPPRLDSPLLRRTPTPTKEVLLQAVKRKQEREDPIFTDIGFADVKTFNKHKPSCTLEKAVSSMMDQSVDSCSPKVKSLPKKDDAKPKVVDKDSSDDDDDDDDDDSDDGKGEVEEEVRKAPNQLLLEFLVSIMSKNYETASKLCKMILIYEPANPEALNFQPLIEEKMRQDEESSDVSEESGADDDDDDDEYDDDDDDDDDSSEDDSDDAESDDDREEEEDEEEVKMDSGIASASE